MTASGSIDFDRTTNQLIKAALRLARAIDPRETPSAGDYEDAKETLNMMVKAWDASGIHLWKQSEFALFLVKDKQSYSIGSTGDNATFSYVETDVATAASSGATAIVVDSVAGMSASDNIGIELDGGDLQWTTISSIVGTTVNLDAALTDDVSVDASVFVYTTKMERPMMLADLRYRDSSGIETPIEMVSRQTYMELSNKASTGQTVQAYYSPQLTNGVLYTWPVADDVQGVIKGTATRRIQDFDATTDTPDLPQEWLEAIKYNLASRLADEYGLPLMERQYLDSKADRALAVVESFDTEDPILFSPDFRYSG